MKTYLTTILSVFLTACVRALPLAFILLFTVTAMAQDGWVWQNPRPTGNQLLQVQFVDELAGIAVGISGTVMRTTDGGLTWQMHAADAMSSFIPWGMDLLDAKSGVAYGHQAVFLTRDGGITWKDISDSTASPWMGDCSLSSENTITCVGDGLLRRTVDGGESWERIIVPGAVNLSGVSFVSDEVGWVVGGGGAILHTTDGGQTWVRQSSGTFLALSDIEFTDELVGAVVGDGVFLYTSDAGATWSRLSVPWSPRERNFLNMDLTSSSLVVVVEGPLLYITDDVGETWRMVSDGSIPAWNVAILNSTTMVALANDDIYRTSDGGVTWVPTSAIESFTQEQLADVWFTDRNTGIVVGDNGTIFRTTDAGQTWELQRSGTESWLDAVAFRGPNLGVAVGSTILRTTDGGITWTRVRPGDNWVFRDVAFVDDNVVVVLSHASILRSEDGGVTWSEQYREPAGEILFTMAFSDSMTGWVSGRDIVLKTGDGGRTWAYSEEELPWYFGSNSFVDEDTGFALEGHLLTSGIYRTDDGGETWQFQLEVWGGLNGLYAIDGNVVTVVGAGGKILRTETGGIVTNREAGPLIQEVPAEVSLDQNYPNPFNPTTSISYALPQSSEATLTVYDMLGRQVSVLASGTQPAGSYEVTFDATGLPCGVYLYRLQAGNFVAAKRMVVVK